MLYNCLFFYFQKPITVSPTSAINSSSTTVLASALFPTVPWSMSFRNVSGTSSTSPSSAASSSASPSKSVSKSSPLKSQGVSSSKPSLIKSPGSSVSSKSPPARSAVVSSLPKDIASSKPYQTVQELCNKLLAGSKPVQTTGSSTSLGSVSISQSLPKSKKASTNKNAYSKDDFGFANLLAKPHIQGHNNDKPLNLVTKDCAGKLPEAGVSNSYKSTHPIGSRRATESVITYHEPMLQSVANSIFKNKQNVNFGKRKMDEDKSKSEPGTPDQKKTKLHTSPPSMADPKVNKKKKCSIENIIERIRTEKTVSRGSPGGNGIGENGQNTQLDVESDSATNSVQYENKTKAAAEVDIKNEHIEGSHGNVSAANDVKAEKEENKAMQQNVVQGTGRTKIDDAECGKANEAVCKIEPSDDYGVKVVERTMAEKTNSGSFDCKMSNGSTKTSKASANSDVIGSENKEFPDDATKDASKNTGENKKKKIGQNEAGKAVKKKPNENVKAQEEQRGAKKTKAKEESQDGNESKGVKKKTCGLSDEQKKVQNKDVKKAKVKNDEKSNEQKKEDAKQTSSKKPNKKETDTNEKKKVVKKEIEKKGKKDTKETNNDEKNSGSVAKGKRKLSDVEKSGAANESQGKKTKLEKATDSGKKKTKGKTDEDKSKTGVKNQKNKLPIACRRVKREASLNAATFVNILCESPRTAKLGDKRSKSDSDLKLSPHKNLPTVSVSVSNLDLLDGTESVSLKDGLFTKVNSAIKVKAWSAKVDARKNSQSEEVKSPGKPKMIKSLNLKRKVSFSDESFDTVFDAVIQRSVKEAKAPVAKKLKDKDTKLGKKNVDGKQKKGENAISKKNTSKECIKQNKKSEKMDKKFRLKKIKKAIKLTASKSPDEMAEKKRKASLARLERAKELLKTKKRISDEFSSDESKSSDSESVSTSNISDDTESEVTVDSDKGNDLSKKDRAKKGSLCRAARTHVLVESKTVVENAMPSPRWCECCQSTYYPNQPSQGAQVWRIKHLVDKGSSKSPEPIQTSSHHFISAHASNEVRPYASPSHMSVIESNPYVSQIMPHGHIQCSACSCGHSGLYHTTSCQNCTLSGVGNLMSCQRYGNPYSVTYPHSHGSYTHCGK